MDNALLVLQVAMSLVPTIIPLIHAVEKAGNGVDKLKVITDAVIASLKLLPPAVQAKIPADQIAAFVQAVVSSIVSFYNLTGVFKKELPPATDPAPPVDPKVTRIAEINAEILKLQAQIAKLNPATDGRKILTKQSKLAALEDELEDLQ